jgi:hypothetical protein
MPDKIVVGKFKTGNCNDCNKDIIVSRVKNTGMNKFGRYNYETLENRGSIVKVHSSKYILVCKSCFNNKYANNYSHLGFRK